MASEDAYTNSDGLEGDQFVSLCMTLSVASINIERAPGLITYKEWFFFQKSADLLQGDK